LGKYEDFEKKCRQDKNKAGNSRFRRKKGWKITWSFEENKEKFEKEGVKLLEEVAKAGLAAQGNLYWSRFDPPWKPGFLRHNEVLIRVKKER
jgi:hypothetical protein